LRKVPPPGVEPSRPKKRSPLAPERSLSSMSGATEFTIHCGDIAHLGIDTDEKIARAMEAIHSVDHADALTKPSLHETSLAETSAGPEWSQEQSLELLSAGPSLELLTAGQSFMTGAESTETVLQHSSSHKSCCHQHAHNHSLHSFLEHDHLHSIGDDAPPSIVTQRSPLVAVVETQKRTSELDDDTAPVTRKRNVTLQIAAAPHHVCLAFDPFIIEKERGELADGVSTLMHPKTRRLFQDISDAGKFPKKNVLRSRHIPPLRYSGSKRTQSAPEDVSVLGSLETGGLLQMPTLQIPILQDEFPAFGGASFDDDWHALGSARHPLQDAGDRLRAFFPASARR